MFFYPIDFRCKPKGVAILPQLELYKDFKVFDSRNEPLKTIVLSQHSLRNKILYRSVRESEAKIISQSPSASLGSSMPEYYVYKAFEAIQKRYIKEAEAEIIKEAYQLLNDVF